MLLTFEGPFSSFFCLEELLRFQTGPDLYGSVSQRYRQLRVPRRYTRLPFPTNTAHIFCSFFMFLYFDIISRLSDAAEPPGFPNVFRVSGRFFLSPRLPPRRPTEMPLSTISILLPCILLFF